MRRLVAIQHSVEEMNRQVFPFFIPQQILDIKVVQPIDYIGHFLYLRNDFAQWYLYLIIPYAGRRLPDGSHAVYAIRPYHGRHHLRRQRNGRIHLPARQQSQSKGRRHLGRINLPRHPLAPESLHPSCLGDAFVLRKLNTT